MLTWRAEDAFFRAFPALEEMDVGAWRLRFAPGVSRRANSANPRRTEFTDLDNAIATCAAEYRRRGLPAIFRVPSFLAPELDRSLAALGYTEEGATRTLYGHRDAVAAEADAQVELRARPDAAWLAAMAGLQGYSATQSATYRGIVGRIAVPAVFAALRVDGDVAALAYGTLDGDIHVCESVITAPAHRRRGYAQRTLAALHRWAIDGGARHFCLQVEATNARAVNLYQGLGLRGDLYGYHYRREPLR